MLTANSDSLMGLDRGAWLSEGPLYVLWLLLGLELALYYFILISLQSPKSVFFFSFFS